MALILLALAAAAGVRSAMAMRASAFQEELGLVPGPDFEHPGKMSTMRDDMCMDYNNQTGQVYMNQCTGSITQQWYFQYGALLSVNVGCLETTGMSIKVAWCHFTKNQRFYWDGQRLRSQSGVLPYCLQYDKKSSVVNVGICKKDKKTQQWRSAQAALAPTTTTSTTFVHVRTRSDFNRCLDYNTSTGIAFLNDCSDSDTQLWYRDSNLEIHSKEGGPKKVLISSEAKAQMVDHHQNPRPFWIWRWRSINGILEWGDDDKHRECLDYSAKSSSLTLEKCVYTRSFQSKFWATNDINVHGFGCCDIPVFK